MVRLAIWRQYAPYKITLEDAIQFELQTQQPRLQLKALRIDVDLDASVASTRCSDTMRTAIETVLGLAIDRSPKRGELLIVGCTTHRGIELEIADCGDDFAFPRFTAFHHRDCCHQISAPPNCSDVSYYGAHCPQGGMAWTIVIKPQFALARAA